MPQVKKVCFAISSCSLVAHYYSSEMFTATGKVRTSSLEWRTITVWCVDSFTNYRQAVVLEWNHKSESGWTSRHQWEQNYVTAKPLQIHAQREALKCIQLDFFPPRINNSSTMKWNGWFMIVQGPLQNIIFIEKLDTNIHCKSKRLNVLNIHCSITLISELEKRTVNILISTIIHVQQDLDLLHPKDVFIPLTNLDWNDSKVSFW